MLGPNEGLVGASLKLGGELYEPDNNNFGPQVGFAWTPGPLQRQARGAWRLRHRLQPAAGFADARVTVQPAVLRGLHADWPEYPLQNGWQP